MRARFLSILVVSLSSLAIAACGDDVGSVDGETVEIVVSTALLGDVVAGVVGDEAVVNVVMSRGADPHSFQPSAKQVAEIANADVLVVNGAGFEVGLLDAVESAEDDGVSVFVAIDAVEPLEPEEGSHDDDEHEGVDPHFFSDPARMADAVTALTSFLTDRFPELGIRERADAYIDELRDLDAEVEATLADIPAADRILVTNHEVLGYFADRYDFEVVGTVIPGGSTGDAVSARDLDALVDVLVERDVPAVFAETSSPADLAEALAAESETDVEVVTLHAESLGQPGGDAASYIDMVRSNARRIAAALDGSDA